MYHAEIAPLMAEPARVDRWLGWLQPAERVRFDRFRHDDDRFMFLCGRAMARDLVGRALGLAPEAWPWREGPHGRPEIGIADTALRFNVAHSAGTVVCALAAGRDVGVDVEDRARRPVDPDVVGRYCSPAEVADVQAQGPAGWHDRFLLYWTLKEAYLKARGLGISVPLAEISFAVAGRRARVDFLGSLAGTDRTWTFELHEPSARHLIAVAAAGEGDGALFHRFEPARDRG